MVADSAAPLVAGYDGLIVDADGVLFRGPQVVDHAVDALTWVSRQAHRMWGVVTNNAAHPPSAVAAKLQGLGYSLDAEQVITSPQGAASYLRDQGLAAGARVFVVGGPGIDEAMREAGFEPVREPGASVAAVVQGFGPDLRWADLAQAAYAIEGGAMWVATNGDLTLPTAEGLAPGNGSMVQAVANAAGRMPDAITGKPEPLLMQVAAERWGLQRPLVVGDRIDTDIRGGNRAGMDTLLVLTGVTGREQLQALHEAPEEDRPTYLAHDLRALAAPAGECAVVGVGRAGRAGRAGRTGGDDGGPEVQDTDWLVGVRSTLAQAWAH